MYNFRKIRNEEGYSEFYHPLFKRGDLSNLAQIERKTSKTDSQVIKKNENVNGANFDMHYKIARRLKKTEYKLECLVKENLTLKSTIKQLVFSNEEYQKLNNEKLEKLYFFVEHELINANPSSKKKIIQKIYRLITLDLRLKITIL